MNDELKKELEALAEKYKVQIFGNVNDGVQAESFVFGEAPVVLGQEEELERLKKLLDDNKIEH